ncbi:hypothetical protein C731_1555 [Mycolicibacterium hassiacum DSM 44199]|uniref:Uncharacterized protein n=1 Tax=Mycolicibacterium hassiacum (strain DSM 44199 / CIP 105218 / JCM 12690 / 3849) TaxID=1122247 RepID=K5BH09_MYCHD|nr:hypothetical protein C731_1555 [Mycolicibacterium hassiacum DSM 44199]MDA4084939.1 hypothetical protein [Mycolicibacterium hassiacum DSM 44199]
MAATLAGAPGGVAGVASALLAVRGETMDISAAAAYVQPDSTTDCASRKRQRGVNAALA